MSPKYETDTTSENKYYIMPSLDDLADRVRLLERQNRKLHKTLVAVTEQRDEALASNEALRARVSLLAAQERANYAETRVLKKIYDMVTSERDEARYWAGRCYRAMWAWHWEAREMRQALKDIRRIVRARGMTNKSIFVSMAGEYVQLIYGRAGAPIKESAGESE